jgi:4-hydroxyphenylacetate 3-monooxygenase
MCAYSDEAGGSVNVALAIPRSRDALCVRRAAITQWANLTGGFVGRSPDHVGGFLAGFASAPEVFNRGDRSFGENVTQFYRRVVSDDLFVSYVIIPPQGAGVVSGVDQVRVVGESSEGMVVSGAQILGTSSAVSDFLFVSCIRPLRPDQETEAVSFVVPLAAPGLRLHCRRPYGQGQPSVFDYPLSTRFDETDAVAVFDEVVVPWENVFVCRDVALTRDQFFATAAHVLGNSQAQIRFVVKLKLILAVAHRMAEVNGIDSIPSVQEKLGELASLAVAIEGAVIAAEASAAIDDHGVAVPNPRFVYGPMGLQSELYPRVLQTLRELSGSSVLQAPGSFRDLNSDDAPRYLGDDGEDKVKLYRLAWDIIGSEFAGRHLQYEMFYAGAPFVTKGYAYRNYGFSEPLALLDTVMSGWSLQDAFVDYSSAG